MTKPRRIAMLIELPSGLENEGIAALRRFLKSLIRTYGIKCISIIPSEEAKVFAVAQNASKSIETDPDEQQAQPNPNVLSPQI